MPTACKHPAWPTFAANEARGAGTCLRCASSICGRGRLGQPQGDIVGRAVDERKEEIGARTALFTLEGIKGQERAYIEWLLAQCTKDDAPEIVSGEAIDRLAAALTTPLQIEQYLTLAFEAGYQVGAKPVTVEIVETVLAADLDALEAPLTRNGYSARAIAETLNVRPAEIRAFLLGQLAPGRTQELHAQLLAAGLPV